MTGISHTVGHFLIPRRGAGLLLIVFALFGGMAGQAGAQETTLYSGTQALFEVRDLRVDKTAQNASRAKAEAFRDVQRRAYGILIAKITEVGGAALENSQSMEAIEALVSGLDILGEQSSSRRYRARISVRFSPVLFADHLSTLGIPHVLSSGPDIRVLEKHSDAGRQNVWAPTDFQMKAREALDLRNRIRRYDFHTPTLKDRLSFSLGSLSLMDPKTYKGVGSPEKRETVLLLETVFLPDGTLQIQYRLGDNPIEDIVIQGRGAKAERLQQGYARVFDQIDSVWRSQLLIDTRLTGSLDAELRAGTAQAFNQILDGLAAVTLIKSLEIQYIGVPTSLVRLQYQGRLDQLTLALGYGGLSLQQIDGIHILRLSSEVSPTRALNDTKD